MDVKTKIDVTTDPGYMFGPFILYPSEYRLYDKEKQVCVALGKRGFDLLVYLVFHGGTLLKKDQLIKAVWEDGFVEEGNLNTQVSVLRKCLGDEGTPPKYIETVRGVGFRFVAPVTKSIDHTCPPAMESTSLQRFRVRAHRFAPLFIPVDENIGTRRKYQWGAFRELQFGESNLHIGEYGIGVWHVRETLDFDCLTDLALWRRDNFRSMLNGKHQISVLSASLPLRDKLTPSETLLVNPLKLEYIFSVFELQSHSWQTQELSVALQLLSSPKTLLHYDGAEATRDIALRREREWLSTRFFNSDLKEFGTIGSFWGYAGWAGVAVGNFGASSPVSDVLVQFELALQALWMYCHAINGHAKVHERPLHVRKMATSVIRECLRRLRSIGPKEPAIQRTMCEAILATSRIDVHTREALEHLESI